LSATDGCDWSTEVGDVRQCQSMQRLVCQQTQLELDALRDGTGIVELVVADDGLYALSFSSTTSPTFTQFLPFSRIIIYAVSLSLVL